MKDVMKYFLSGAVALLASGMCFSQKSIDSTIHIISISDFNVHIDDAASKIKDQPVNDDTSKVIPILNYKLTPRRISTNYTPGFIEPPRMVGEPLKRLYKLYVKGGFGNYTTPYGELFFNSLRSKEMSYGVHLRHQSSSYTSRDHGYSGYSDNEVDLYGKRFILKHTLSAGLDYNRNVAHCYGYDAIQDTVERDFTKNLFQDMALNLSLQSHLHDSESVNHTIVTRFDHFNDNHSCIENNLFAGAGLRRHYLDQLVYLETSVDYYNNHLQYDTVNDAIIRFAPSVKWGGEKFNSIMGVDVTADVATKTRFHFYPKLEVNYDIIDQIIIPYAGIRGGLKHNSYRMFANENPFIEPNQQFRNTDRKYEFYGGLRGSLSANINYNVYTSWAKLNDMYFYTNDFTEVLQNRFKVVYDSVKALNLHGEIGYRRREKINFVFKGDYYRYYMLHEPHAWYRPQMQLTFTLNYNLKDKILAHADVFVIGSQLANRSPQSTVPQNFVELKGVTDINVGFEYRYNKKLSAFANFSNLGAFRYERWQNYPTMGFHFLAGLTYAL